MSSPYRRSNRESDGHRSEPFPSDDQSAAENREQVDWQMRPQERRRRRVPLPRDGSRSTRPYHPGSSNPVNGAAEFTDPRQSFGREYSQNGMGEYDNFDTPQAGRVSNRRPSYSVRDPRSFASVRSSASRADSSESGYGDPRGCSDEIQGHERGSPAADHASWRVASSYASGRAQAPPPSVQPATRTGSRIDLLPLPSQSAAGASSAVPHSPPRRSAGGIVDPRAGHKREIRIQAPDARGGQFGSGAGTRESQSPSRRVHYHEPVPPTRNPPSEHLSGVDSSVRPSYVAAALPSSGQVVMWGQNESGAARASASADMQLVHAASHTVEEIGGPPRATGYGSLYPSGIDDGMVIRERFRTSEMPQSSAVGSEPIPRPSSEQPVNHNLPKGGNPHVGHLVPDVHLHHGANDAPQTAVKKMRHMNTPRGPDGSVVANAIPGKTGGVGIGTSVPLPDVNRSPGALGPVKASGDYQGKGEPTRTHFLNNLIENHARTSKNEQASQALARQARTQARERGGLNNSQPSLRGSQPQGHGTIDVDNDATPFVTAPKNVPTTRNTRLSRRRSTPCGSVQPQRVVELDVEGEAEAEVSKDAKENVSTAAQAAKDSAVKEELLEKWKNVGKLHLLVDFNSIRDKVFARIDRFASLQQNLHTLNLAFCGLNVTSLGEILPNISSRFSSLRELSLENNQLEGLPDLDAMGRELKESVSRVMLQSNLIDEVPNELLSFCNLTWINLARNKLTSVPVELFELKALEVINLGENEISALPPGLGNLKRLQLLRLQMNRLTCLPSDIGESNEALTVVDVSGNREFCGGVPARFASVKHQLSGFDIADTRLDEILPRKLRTLEVPQLIDLVAGKSDEELEQTIAKIQEATSKKGRRSSKSNVTGAASTLRKGASAAQDTETMDIDALPSPPVPSDTGKVKLPLRHGAPAGEARGDVEVADGGHSEGVKASCPPQRRNSTQGNADSRTRKSGACATAAASGSKDDEINEVDDVEELPSLQMSRSGNDC